jgi:hypothetical protein
MVPYLVSYTYWLCGNDNENQILVMANDEGEAETKAKTWIENDLYDRLGYKISVAIEVKPTIL